ncbi:host cell division inhibitor Icd-like protein [Rodentibacter ratti]|nr:host cell division inhibitor Icd-like protein [Rodentibacter ratti]
MRNTRTPQIMAGFVLHNQKPIILSMVERNRQPLAVGCLPCMAVSYPVTFYRQTVGSLAVVPEKFIQGLSKMLFKFLCVDRTHSHFNLCTQTIQANNETQARLRLSADFRHIATVARINLTLTAYFPIVSTSTQGGLANA